MIHGWELALIIFAITVLLVNTVNVVVQLKVLSKFDRILNKSIFIVEKMLDQAEEEFSEMKWEGD